MWLRFHRVRTGSFRDGREKLLVDFTDEKNQAVGDWCPAWHDVERIVLSAVDVEQTNDGDYVDMLRKVEEKLAQRLPKLGIARHEALIHSYEPPNLNAEILDHDRPGWGPHRSFRLTCPIPQRLLDLVVANGIRAHLVVREQSATDVRVWAGNEEVSLSSPSAADLEILSTSSGGLLVHGRR
jgi:hypothetical protein